jgi:hypothetical protein
VSPSRVLEPEHLGTFTYVLWSSPMIVGWVYDGCLRVLR